MSESTQWICCQLGAREHYAIPRALCRTAVLARLITDAWAKPASLFATANPSFGGLGIGGRWHEELRNAPVAAFNLSLIAFELLARARRLSGWERIIARNEWFQRRTVRWLRRNAERLKSENAEIILFSYSYAARDIFRFAKSQGWRTVLGQIDPGPIEEDIVAREAARVPELAAHWQRAPAEYWKAWREECDLADHIVVNSEWSRTCLEQARVNDDKLFVVPLAYEPPNNQQRITHNYPERFTKDRPLRVLFLGQVNLRKGVAHLLDAIRLLQGEPIEFSFVGPVQICIPPDLAGRPQIRWVGPVPRSRAAEYYRNADVMIFPTLSDGFGLTQLEAQAFALPVIASNFCGDVVVDRCNGWRLPEVSGGAIASALQHCLQHPNEVQLWSENSAVPEQFSLDTLAARLIALPESRARIDEMM